MFAQWNRDRFRIVAGCTSRRSPVLPYGALISLLALCLLSGLAACSPIDGVFGRDDASPVASSAATQRPRATPVATIAGPPRPDADRADRQSRPGADARVCV